MPQLIVRSLEVAVVKALRERAAGQGRSTEAERRAILRDALIANRRRTCFKTALQTVPDVGSDADFARPRADNGGSPCEPAA